MTRALLFLVIFAALCAPTAHAADPSARPGHIANFEHQVRITPTQLAAGETAINFGPTEWTLQGYDLRGLLARVFDMDPTRVQLNTSKVPDSQPQDGDLPRYDLTLALSGDESDAAIQSILRKGLEEHFHLTTTLEIRPLDVYVLTAPAGPGRGLRAVSERQIGALKTSAASGARDRQSVITLEGRVCPGISSAGITAQYATVERLAAALEESLDRIVLDETHLTPAFDFHISEYRSQDELFALLHEELGLSVRLERREVKVLTAHRPDEVAPAPLTGR